MRVAVILVLAACGDSGSSNIDAPAGIDASPDASGTCAPSRTIFLNKGGGTFMPGNDDATTNTTPLVGNTSRNLSPATIVDADWTNVAACVRAKLAGYKLDIVEANPGTKPHIEIVVIDNGNQIGMPGIVNTAFPPACSGGFGTAATNTIAFVAWLGNDNSNHCWDVTQTIGYTLGLDNVLPCADLMSVNLSGCTIPSKVFTDVDSQCGQTAAQACRCGGQMQNAKQRLTANVGVCP